MFELVGIEVEFLDSPGTCVFSDMVYFLTRGFTRPETIQVHNTYKEDY